MICFQLVVFLASVALCHAGGWGGVTIIGPAAKGAAYGAAGAVIAPARSAGVVTAAITPGAILKTGPALFAAPIAYAAPAPAPIAYAAPAPAPIAYAAPAPAPVVLEPVPAIGKGESVISGPSGSITAGPGGKALLVGPPGSAVPDYSAYAYGGGYGGGYAGYGGEGAWEGEGRWGGKGKW